MFSVPEFALLRPSDKQLLIYIRFHVAIVSFRMIPLVCYAIIIIGPDIALRE